MSWQLSLERVGRLVTNLLDAAKPNAVLSLHDVEVLHGRLNNFAQLAQPLSMLVGEALQFTRDLLEKLPIQGKRRGSMGTLGFGKSQTYHISMTNSLRSI